MPVDWRLGNNLETSTWKEVELRSHLGMLWLPEWACVTIRCMAAKQGNQTDLEPETVAQMTAKRKGKGCRKPAPEVPTVQKEADLEEDALAPTGEQVAELGNYLN
ncbi:hypothetical protein NDU88_004775 [Pleurodeles waltl]|uniref:Uncharacterized protein n=1 Tax=Pleurodeles waltl TaxID=8319 RepID=A0AAV7T932_PLEWA|nr:hypothetical protein NDU88_004775 [Pleurodeles waltl]